MAVKIQVKRGAESNLPNLSQGELGFTTDTNKVFVGDGASNHEIITANSFSLDSRYFTETELENYADENSAGGKKIGIYNNVLDNSSSDNVQDVLKDLDKIISNYKYLVKTSDYTAVSGNKLIVAGGVTITLPSNPSIGDAIYFAVGGDWETSNMIVGRNGKNIMGDASDLIVSVNKPFALAYQDGSRGWVLAI